MVLRGELDNFCSRPRGVYFGILLPPPLAVTAYALTGVLAGATFVPVLVLASRTINAQRLASVAVGVGVALGVLLFLASLRIQG